VYVAVYVGDEKLRIHSICLFRNFLSKITFLMRKNSDSTQSDRWQCIEQPSYCSDVASSDFHLFGALKDHLGGHRCWTNVEVQDAVSQSF